MVDVLTPEDPFSIELDVTIGLAEVISRTAGNLPWIPQKKQGKETLVQEKADEARREITMAILDEGPQGLIASLLNTPSVSGGDVP